MQGIELTAERMTNETHPKAVLRAQALWIRIKMPHHSSRT